MHILNMEVENYRTFASLQISFDRQMNYLVGSHHVGKTNFLDLLEVLHERQVFQPSDFLDQAQPICIRLTLQLEPKQVLLIRGVPYDDTNGVLHIKVTQHAGDDMLRIEDTETGKVLSAQALQYMYFLRHVPSLFGEEANGRRKLNDLYDRLETYLHSHRSDAAAYLRRLAEATGANPDIAETLADSADTWLNYLAGDAWPGRDAEQTFRAVVIAGFQFLQGLLTLCGENRGSIIEGTDGKQYLPLLLCIDEPEIHLTPYIQRTLLTFYQQVLRNENELMRDIFREVLGIDGIEGQLFVATHSTDCLIDDYRCIIRLYREPEGKVQAACGSEFTFPAEVEKHLIMHFPEMKEALFARAVLVVEGETEYGSFRGFGHTLGVHFNMLGICLVNARGESSIFRLCELFRSFHLGTVALYDRDVSGKIPRDPDIFFTDEICYELDVVETLWERRALGSLHEIVMELQGDDRVYGEMVRKAKSKWDPDPRRNFQARKLQNISGRDSVGMRFYYFAWMYGNKGVMLGRLLAEKLTAEQIPPAFVRVLRRTEELAR